MSWQKIVHVKHRELGRDCSFFFFRELLFDIFQMGAWLSLLEANSRSFPSGRCVLKLQTGETQTSSSDWGQMAKKDEEMRKSCLKHCITGCPNCKPPLKLQPIRLDLKTWVSNIKWQAVCHLKLICQTSSIAFIRLWVLTYI